MFRLASNARKMGKKCKLVLVCFEKCFCCVIIITRRGVVGIAFIVLGVIVLCFALNYLVYKRSMSASIAEFGLRLSPYKRRKLDKVVKKQQKPYKVPKVKCKIEYFEFNEMPVYLLSSDKKEGKLVVYIHGGAYVVRPTKFHWRFCEKLVF